MTEVVRVSTELRDLRVEYISLVGRGANGKKVVWKGSPGEGEPVEVSLRSVVKSDERRMVYGIVYSPDEVDSQGEFATAAEIEGAAYGFMKGLRLLNVDSEHDFDPKAAFVAESWLLKGVDPLFPTEKAGSWAVGVRVEDDALWERVKKGELSGLSMAGVARKIKKEEVGFLAKLEELLARILKTADSAAQRDGEGDGDDGEAVRKAADAIRAMERLVETVKKQEERLDALEKSTAGRRSGAPDGDTSAQGASFA